VVRLTEKEFKSWELKARPKTQISFVFTYSVGGALNYKISLGDLVIT